MASLRDIPYHREAPPEVQDTPVPLDDILITGAVLETARGHLRGREGDIGVHR
jgi:hypothetical protein